MKIFCVLLVGGLCLVSDFDQMWSEKCAPHWRTSSRSGLRPNVVKKNCPSSEDFFSSRTLTKCGPILRPLSEDFVSSRTSTKCGPILRPSLEDFVSSWTSTKCGPILRPSSEDFVSSRTLTKCGQKMRPSSEDFVASRTFFDKQKPINEHTGRSKQSIRLSLAVEKGFSVC
jgi:hypothetical protein